MQIFVKDEHVTFVDLSSKGWPETLRALYHHFEEPREASLNTSVKDYPEESTTSVKEIMILLAGAKWKARQPIRDSRKSDIWLLVLTKVQT